MWEEATAVLVLVVVLCDYIKKKTLKITDLNL